MRKICAVHKGRHIARRFVSTREAILIRNQTGSAEAACDHMELSDPDIDTVGSFKNFCSTIRTYVRAALEAQTPFMVIAATLDVSDEDLKTFCESANQGRRGRAEVFYRALMAFLETEHAAHRYPTNPEIFAHMRKRQLVHSQESLNTAMSKGRILNPRTVLPDDLRTLLVKLLAENREGRRAKSR